VVVGGHEDHARAEPAEVDSVHRIALAPSTARRVSFTTIPESARRVIRFHLDGQLIHAPTRR